MSRTPGKPEMTRPTLAVLFLGVLIAASVWILSPFLPALIWATMVVIASWPMMLRLEQIFGKRRGPAVLVMTLLVLLIFVVPLSLAIATLVDNADEIAVWARYLADFQVPAPPEWVAELPMIGPTAEHAWKQIAASGPTGLAAKAVPYAGNLSKWFVSEVGSFGLVFVQFLLTVALSAVLYTNGEGAARGLRRFGYRLAGQRGEGSIVLAGQAVRAVALGVGITALAQSVLGGIGLAIAGVPFAGLLTALMFMFCIAQLGPGLVLLPAVVWLYWSESTGWGTFLLVWTLLVGTMDNFLRPLLIRKGADLPLLLILAGVIGGMLAFGLVGIFIGPVVLAVSYTLLEAWIREAPADLERRPDEGAAAGNAVPDDANEEQPAP
ncbi:AI-2E family transporter YdiK [Accumulibacter sp.]|uniref:AI-2E family transporter YdiK n=1 Tax=Accumulibacter sp. TaxID=2053492 RepID=UPI0025D1488C|nr:AI-2E family transporter YdiK [Accumulibacter sp.]MCM8596525.1 AI-2E family transporter YdiK [Accumulibacter sp.]MCM8626942.1 AI-2E family transporter YdiK [Accumulibacter sp.]MDS4050674.1 AI-2E family transporter YdiK [Accumulibacter sp.]